MPCGALATGFIANWFASSHARLSCLCRLQDILFPALLAALFRCPHNAAVLRDEVDLSLLADYLRRRSPVPLRPPRPPAAPSSSAATPLMGVTPVPDAVEARSNAKADAATVGSSAGDSGGEGREAEAPPSWLSEDEVRQRLLMLPLLGQSPNVLVWVLSLLTGFCHAPSHAGVEGSREERGPQMAASRRPSTESMLCTPLGLPALPFITHRTQNP